MTAHERWLIDGYEITDGWLRDVELRDGLYVTPGPTGSNGKVSNRTGDLWRSKRLGPGGFVLNMWIAGGDRAEIEDNYDNIVRALIRPHALLTVDRYLADGTIRTCQAEIAQQINPSPVGQVGMRLSAEFKVPAGRWFDKTPSTINAAAGATVPKTIVFTGTLATATASLSCASVPESLSAICL